MTRILSILALLASGAAAWLALCDDYDSAYGDGARAMCSQLTAGAGRVHDGLCQVPIDGVWLTPRVEIRTPDRDHE